MTDYGSLSPRGALVFVWVLLSILFILFIVRILVLRRLRSRNSQTGYIGDLVLVLGMAMLTVEVCTMTWTAVKRMHYDAHPNPLVLPALGMPLADSIVQQKLSITAVFSYYTSVWCVKSSFLLYYYEFDEHLHKGLRIFLYILTAIIALTFVTNIILTGTWCTPIWRAWTFDQRYCSPVESVQLITFGAFSNIGTDLLLMIFPLFIILRLNLQPKQKWAVAIMFAIGTATVTAALVRFLLIYHFLGNQSTAGTAKFWQETQITSGVEQWIGMVAACLPALRALLTKRWRKNQTNRGYSYEGNNAGSSGGNSGRKFGNKQRGPDTELLELTRVESEEAKSMRRMSEVPATLRNSKGGFI